MTVIESKAIQQIEVRGKFGKRDRNTRLHAELNDRQVLNLEVGYWSGHKWEGWKWRGSESLDRLRGLIRLATELESEIIKHLEG